MLNRSSVLCALLLSALLPGCGEEAVDSGAAVAEPTDVGGGASEDLSDPPDDLVGVDEPVENIAFRAPDHPEWSSFGLEDEHAHDSLRSDPALSARKLAPVESATCNKADLKFTSWPVSGVHGKDWMIHNYSDQDSAATLKDYKGKTGSLARTYDGHRGADICIPSMRQMDAGTSIARAAAAGKVEFVREDQFDRNTSCTGTWNVVLLRHANGYSSYYGHLKKNSVVVNVGDNVVAGQKLGVVGSSGCSTQAHLHFEVHDCNDNWLESFDSMWSTPPVYEGPSDVMDVILKKGAFAGVGQLKDPAANPTIFKPGTVMGVGLSVATRGGDAYVIEMVSPANVVSSWTWTVPGVARYGQWFPSWTWTVGSKPGTWTLRVKLNGVVTQTHAFKVSNYVPGFAEIARHGVPAAGYQDAFTDATIAGYRPVWVDGFDVGGATYYNAIFRPVGNVSWVARHGLTAAQYQTEFDTWTQAGLRLSNIDAYLVGGAVRYAAIFSNEPGAAWTAYHGVSEATHVAQFNTLKAQGYHPVNVSVVGVGGVRLVTALYDKSAFGGWVALHKIPAASYQAEYNTQAAAGRRPHYLNAYTLSGAVYYSAVFSSLSLGSSFVARHGLSGAQYQTEFNNWSGQGLLTKFVTGVSSGGSAAYAAVWNK
jgi:murein DD-endopeptidase MepM/ murein hydrolase activator NlpD